MQLWLPPSLSLTHTHTNIHANSYIGLEGASRSSALPPPLPNLTCVTFRVFSSLECDWKRKTMHWSSLDSVLLSALQRKHGREGLEKNQSHIHHPQWVSKKKKKKRHHTVVWLSRTHGPGYTVLVWLWASWTHWACAERRSKQSRSVAQLL